uniref:Transmembrane protein n=1 Tax=Cacopsylla melanoneura TaxID=428564 RepID=A0A8D8W315_9HEMI
MIENEIDSRIVNCSSTIHDNCMTADVLVFLFISIQVLLYVPIAWIPTYAVHSSLFLVSYNFLKKKKFPVFSPSFFFLFSSPPFLSFFFFFEKGLGVRGSWEIRGGKVRV